MNGRLVRLAMLVGLALCSVGAVAGWVHWSRPPSQIAVIRQLDKQIEKTSDGVRNAYATGRDSAARGDFIRAEEHLSVALANAPECTLIRYELAAAYVSLGRPSDALAHFQHVVEEEPRFARAWMGAGLSEIELDRFAEAEASFRQALKLDPLLGPAYGGLALSLRRQGRLEEAEALLTRLVRDFPKQQPVWLALGDLLSDLPGEAAQRRGLEAYRRANETQVSPYGLMREGQVAFRLKDLDRAAQLLRKGRKLAPHDSAIAYVQAQVAQAMGAPDAGMLIASARELQSTARHAARLQAFIAEDPGAAGPHFELARLERRRGNTLAAIRYYRAGLRLAPEDRAARDELDRLEDAQMRNQSQ